jgi:hypothetical protein
MPSLAASLHGTDSYEGSTTWSRLEQRVVLSGHILLREEHQFAN